MQASVSLAVSPSLALLSITAIVVLAPAHVAATSHMLQARTTCYLTAVAALHGRKDADMCVLVLQLFEGGVSVRTTGLHVSFLQHVLCTHCGRPHDWVKGVPNDPG